MSSNLYQHGLIEAQAAIADSQFTALEYLESCIIRAQTVEPAVGVFAWFDAEALRAAARRAQQGILAGMPVGIKDIIATKGVPTEMGSAAFKGNIPDHSAWVVDALAAAGALMFGKTVSTEFAWRHPGKTRNPWNLAHTPGGSSSGSAAGVACGCMPVALGTQTFGSVIRPAAFCGVVGYKPSFGMTPRTGVYPLSHSLDHVGVFARNVADAALVAAVITGRDGIDFPNTPAPVPTWPPIVETSAPRIALLRTSAWSRLDAEQQQLVEATATRLKAAGATVIEVELPAAFAEAWQIAQTLCDAEGAVVNAKLAQEKPPRISKPSLALVEGGLAIPASAYIAALAAQQTLIREFTAVMAGFDAALTAPALGAAPAGLDSTGDALFCIPFSLVGAPAISLPAALAKNGLPLGVQLVAGWGRDRQLLAAAAWVERQLAWAGKFPPR